MNNSRLLKKLNPQNRLQLFLLYTVLFAITLLLMYFPFIITNKSFLSNDDGFLQHYETLVHLKHVISQFLSGKGFSFWSWSVGLGADSIGSLATVYFDPFNYIAAMFPESSISVGYNFEICLQLYVIGLGFLYFGKVTNLNLHHSLWGAFAYTLSSWGILAATKHNCFLTVMLLFILVMSGVEKVLRKQSPIVLILSAALSAITYLYFAYMTALIVFIYLLLYFILKEKKTFKNIILYWGKFILYIGIAACLTAIIIIPVIYILMNAIKDTSTDYNLFHSLSSYIDYITSFIGGQEIFQHYSTICVSSLFLLMLPVIFHNIRSKKATPAMFTFLVCLILLLFPFFNSVFNGFSYPVGRWCYAATFFYIWSGLQCLEEDQFSIVKQRKGITILLVTLGISLIIIERVILNLSNEITIITGVVNLFFACIFYKLLADKKSRTCLSATLITLSIMCNVISVGWVKYSPGFSTALNGFSYHGEIYNKLENSTQKAGTEIDDNAFYRIDQVDYISMTEITDSQYSNVSYRPIHTPANETLAFNTRSIYTYLSTIPGSLLTYYKNVGNNASYFRRICTYSNDNRTRLDFLLGVKYFLGDNPNNNPYTGANAYSSFGFSLDRKSEKGIDILKNEYSIGLGCTFDSYITETEWLQLDYPDREQALMQCVVLPDNLQTDLIHMDYQTISSGSAEAAWHVTDSENILSDGKPIGQKHQTLQQAGTIQVTQNNGNFIMHLDKEYKNCELYLIARNISRKPNNLSVPNEIDLLSRIKYYLGNGSNNKDYGAFSMNVSMGDIQKKASNTIGNVQGLSDISDLMINLGEYNEKAKDISISFDTVGNYSYDSIELLAVPLSTYKNSAYKCSGNAYTITTLTDNYVKGTVKTAESKAMLYLSIPYNPGWRAYIDGVEIPTQQINTAFTGIPVNAEGKHTIELRFRPVGFKVGIIAFLIGIISCILLCIWHTMRKKSGG